ncbi:MAG: hypothetical protein ACJ71Z_08200 [Aeromicrobium sp.]
MLAAAAFGGSGLIPVLSPSVPPEELAAFLSEHKVQILLGMMSLLAGGFTCLLTWSLTFAYQLRKYANPSPLAFYYFVILGIFGGVLAMLMGVFGSAIAYRAETVDPATLQMMYDILWFMFLIPVLPFMLWQVLSGFVILSKSNDGRYFPRWSGYVCLWAGALEVFAALPPFFYKGPFTYNGAVSFWLPGGQFFVWVGVLAFVQVRSWYRTQAEGQDISWPLGDDEDLDVLSAPDVSKV